MINYKKIFEASLKQRYAFKDDGYFSHINKDSYGEFSTFAKAKKELVTYCKQRLDEFKYGLKDLPKKETDVEGDGEYIDLYYDGIYTTIEKSTFETEYKNFKEVKKHAQEFYKQQIQNWQYAWKDAVKLKVDDVE